MGRTKICLQSDLPSMIQTDEKKHLKNNSKKEEKPPDEPESKGPIHYQNVLNKGKNKTFIYNSVIGGKQSIIGCRYKFSLVLVSLIFLCHIIFFMHFFLIKTFFFGFNIKLCIARKLI